MRAITIMPARAAALLGAAALVVAACTSGASSAPSAAASAAESAAASAASAAAGQAYQVAIAQDAKLGAILTGEDGKTLYVLKKDTAGKSACNGQCATNWPPFTLDAGESVTAGSGVTGTLATMKRDDGSTQVTYDGAPLYYFKGDQKAGDTNGQGVSGVWFAATPTGGSSAGASPSPSAASGGGYGAGYGAGHGGGYGSSAP
ncbi:MAG TPA: hypothetical protein VEY67_03735 [Candidatus Dormibacteraeota bacterium]|nr:hypothetical protein [Candidatus Dormibacteraeota bacterium]